PFSGTEEGKHFRIRNAGWSGELSRGPAERPRCNFHDRTFWVLGVEFIRSLAFRISDEVRRPATRQFEGRCPPNSLSDPGPECSTPAAQRRSGHFEGAPRE